MNKRESSRQRRAVKTKKKIAELRVHKLRVHRTPRHIYAQIFSTDGSQVLAQASSPEKIVREQPSSPGKIKVSEVVGRLVAERAKALGIEQVAFDRAGFRYHGRIKALAEAARAVGLLF